jgi:hypothetical protein
MRFKYAIYDYGSGYVLSRYTTKERAQAAWHSLARNSHQTMSEIKIHRISDKVIQDYYASVNTTRRQHDMAPIIPEGLEW